MSQYGYGPLADHVAPGRPSCDGACQQGRFLCPHPEKCVMDDPLAPARGAVVGILLGIGIWACLLFIGVSLYLWWFA